MARVLVCDDDADVRRLVTLVLSDRHEVAEAADGAAALALLHQPGAGFDAVVLDVMLPELDGLEVLRRLRSTAAAGGTAVILLTARTSESDHLSGYQTGADGYVTKPFDPDDLVRVVDEVLAMSPAQRREHRDAERDRAALLWHIERRFD